MISKEARGVFLGMINNTDKLEWTTNKTFRVYYTEQIWDEKNGGIIEVIKSKEYELKEL